MGTLPLEHQPGERWLYHTSSDVLGVLVARAAGQPLDAFLRERVFEPLGMADTGFSVPAADLAPLRPVLRRRPDHRRPRRVRPDRGPVEPRRRRSPRAAAGWCRPSTTSLAFGAMLLAGGVHGGRRLLSRPPVEAMTTNQLTADAAGGGVPRPDGALGWGLGIGVQRPTHGTARSAGSYGWDGGLGSSWANDPAEDLVGVLLTNQMWSSPQPPAVARDFWTATYAAFAD